jgi:hypothetical protein
MTKYVEAFKLRVGFHPKPLGIAAPIQGYIQEVAFSKPRTIEISNHHTFETQPLN